MSGNTNQETAVPEPAPAVSEAYLAAFRQALRITSDAFDGEITDLIRAAREDLALGGVVSERTRDEADPLIKRALVSYVRAEFGLDNEDADQYRAAYDRIKVSLVMSSDYVGSGEG